MQNAFLKLSLQFWITVIGIVLVSMLPFLFFNMEGMAMILTLIEAGKIQDGNFIGVSVGIDFYRYFDAIKDVVVSMVHPGDLKYHYFGEVDKPLFPEMFTRYSYSLKVLMGSFVISVLSACLITFFLILLPKALKKTLRFGVFMLESIPDVFLVIFFQITVVWLYKKTGILFYEIVSIDKPIYFIPIICMSIVPTMYLIKVLIQLFDEELDKHYVELAKAKGLQWPFIVLVHMFRNVLISLHNHSKTIFVLMLSNLLMIEWVLNIKGIGYFLLRYGPVNPELITYGLILIFVPFFLLFALLGAISRKNKRSVYE